MSPLFDPIPESASLGVGEGDSAGPSGLLSMELLPFEITSASAPFRLVLLVCTSDPCPFICIKVWVELAGESDFVLSREGVIDISDSVLLWLELEGMDEMKSNPSSSESID